MDERVTLVSVHFAVALLFSILLTPAARFIGAKLGAFDEPNERKLHPEPVPRVGGLAIVLAFLLTLFVTGFLSGSERVYFGPDRKMAMLLAGGLVVFGIGLIDDFHRISHRVKFGFQILGATIAYLGGVQITNILGFDLREMFWPLSYAATVFWFVLFINAMNLTDGLDGLAAGVAFFSSAAMAVISLMAGNKTSALMFATLAGTCMGFLRYNYNPASIFMGDGGSYFLGYVIAGISVVSSSKSQVGATILIPLIALGVPIFDTLIAPVRRFILGKGMFRPDTGHIHHRLVAMGLSTRKAVSLIYAASFLLCSLALLFVNLHNQLIGIFLISLAILAFLFLKKLGYLEYAAPRRICGWIRDVSDEAGLSHDRRRFLNLQLEICASNTLEELWHNTCRALTALDFDMSKVYLAHPTNGRNGGPARPSGHAERSPVPVRAAGRSGHNGSGANGHTEWVWTYNGFDPERDVHRECLLKMELPLLGESNHNFGTLLLVKDLKRNGFSHYTLRRVEHLRRSVVRSLETLSNGKDAGRSMRG